MNLSRLLWISTFFCAFVGFGLIADSAARSSATYDEVFYMKVGASWWRTGAQDTITRLGSPSLFWKIQQTIPLWCLDRVGHAEWIDDPERFQAQLLPILRMGSLPIWMLAMLATAAWARRVYGLGAMAFTSACFAMSPNLLAHASLATMETPLVACAAGIFLTFWEFLETSRKRMLATSAVLAGIGFSCKYTVVLLIPILGIISWMDLATREATFRPLLSRVNVWVRGGILFLAIAAITNLAATGFSFVPLSPNLKAHQSLRRMPPVWQPAVARLLEMPVPREVAGFAVQSQLQKQGGSSYLFGERREQGWWYYYLAALLVKTSPAFLAMFLARCVMGIISPMPQRSAMMPVAIAIFLAITAIGSTRNFGLRYLLPMAPIAIVWVSGLVAKGGGWRIVAIAGLCGQVVSVVTTHPHELSYFPSWVGGAEGGKRILADSNLDWGQGLRDLSRLQGDHQELRDLTIFYFGDTNPRFYGVSGISHVIRAGNDHPALPPTFRARTPFVAVSRSLTEGPWGPLGYFDRLRNVTPAWITNDHTIAIYRVAEIPEAPGSQ